MKENPENNMRAKRRSAGRTLALVAAILAVLQACLTIEGRGIEGFIAWVIILFAAYWLLFMFLRWLWDRLRNRA